MHSEAQQADEVRQFEFFFDVFAVGLDGLDAHVEVGSDLARFAAAPRASRTANSRSGQPRNRGGVGSTFAIGDLLVEAPTRASEGQPTTKDIADGLDEFSGGSFFIM